MQSLSLANRGDSHAMGWQRPRDQHPLHDAQNPHIKVHVRGMKMADALEQGNQGTVWVSTLRTLNELGTFVGFRGTSALL